MTGILFAADGDGMFYTINQDGSYTVTTPDGSAGITYHSSPSPTYIIDSLNMRLAGYYGLGPNSAWIVMQDTYLYMDAGYGFVIYDVDADPEQPPLVGYCTDLPWFVTGLAPYGDYLYVARESGGLFTYDVSDPTNPQLLDRYSLPGPRTYAWDCVIVNGALCFTAILSEDDPKPELVVCSLDDPAHPAEIVRLDLPFEYIFGLPQQPYCEVDGNSLITGGYPSHICVIDLSNPTDPRIADECDLSDDKYIDRFAYDGNGILYASLWSGDSPETWHYLYSFDVTDFSNPTALDSLQSLCFTETFRLLNKDTLLVTYDDGQNDFFNVSDPETITRIAGWSELGYYLWDCVLQGELLYFATLLRGLYIADITDLTEVKDVWQCSSGATAFMSLTTPVEEECFVSGWSIPRSMEIVHFQTPSSGELYSTDSVRWGIGGWSGFDVFRRGDFVGTIEQKNILFYDVSDLGDVQFLGSVWVEIAGESPTRLFPDGNNLYVSCGPQGVSSAGRPGGMAVVDIAVPTNPSILAQQELPGRCSDIWEKDSVVYVTGMDSVGNSDGYFQIHRYLGDGFEKLAGFELPTPGLGLYLLDNRLYLSRVDALEIYDVSDPGNPSLMGTTTQMLEGRNDDVVVNDSQRVYVASDYELVAFDASEPADPRIVGYYSLPDNTGWVGFRQRLRISGPYLYWTAVSIGFCAIEHYSEEPGVAESPPQRPPQNIDLWVEPGLGRNPTIRYSLPHASHIDITIYDATGRRVEDLYQGSVESGDYTLTWNASGVSAGVYFIRLSASGQGCSERFLILN